MKDINNKFINFEPSEQEKKQFNKFLQAFLKRSPEDSFLNSSVKQKNKIFDGVAKVYSGANYFQVKAEGKNFAELVGKLRAKLIFQLKRWRANEKSHPKRHQYLALAYKNNG